MARLQSEAGGAFCYMWRTACEQRDRKPEGLATYDPSRDEDFAAAFIRDLIAADYDIYTFARARGM